VKHILRYVRGTKNWGLCFGRKEAGLIGFSDNDFASDVDGRKSTMIFFLNSNPIT
jgi:hypothetical protein